MSSAKPNNSLLSRISLIPNSVSQDASIVTDEKRKARLQNYLNKKVHGPNGDRVEEDVRLCRLEDLDFVRNATAFPLKKINYYDDVKQYSRVGNPRYTHLTSTTIEQCVCCTIVIMTLFLFPTRLLLLNKNVIRLLDYKDYLFPHVLTIYEFLQSNEGIVDDRTLMQGVSRMIMTYRKIAEHSKIPWILTIPFFPLNMAIPFCLAFRWPRQRFLGPHLVVNLVLVVLLVNWVTIGGIVIIAFMRHGQSELYDWNQTTVDSIQQFQLCSMNLSMDITLISDITKKTSSCTIISDDIEGYCSNSSSSELWRCKYTEDFPIGWLRNEGYQMFVYAIIVTVFYMVVVVNTCIQHSKYQNSLKQKFDRFNYNSNPITAEALENLVYDGSLEGDDLKFDLQYLPHTSCLCNSSECPYNEEAHVLSARRS